jgi:glycosyltransferase involved in cell wall biosynthesis
MRCRHMVSCRVLPSMLPTVTIAICTKDHPEDLRRCLKSCERARNDVLEILVVDNNSAGDETRRAADDAGARYVRQPRPGLSAARNLAIETARGEVIAFIDDDCEIHDGWVAALVDGFSDREVGCVTAQTALPPGANSVQKSVAAYILKIRSTEPFRIRPADVGRIYHRAFAGLGANMAFRRTALLAAGGFPEALRSSGDDFYMFYAVLRAGFSIHYSPATVITQRHRDRLGAQARRTFQYGRDTIQAVTWLSIENHSVRLLLLNATRVLYNRTMVVAHALRRANLPHLLFGIAHLAGAVDGFLRMPFWWWTLRGPVAEHKAVSAALSASEPRRTAFPSGGTPDHQTGADRTLREN